MRQNNARSIEPLMLSLDECMGMSGLSEDELVIVAEHRRVPLMVAAQIGHTLLGTSKGIFTLRGYMLGALEQAKIAGKTEKARHIDHVLTQFISAHPVPTIVSPLPLRNGRARRR